MSSPFGRKQGSSLSPRFIKIELSSQSSEALSLEAQQLLKSFMLQSVHLDVSLNEFASHGALTFIFKNPIAIPVDMLFAFPLMDGGAVITGITTELDGQRICGRVRPTNEGKTEYHEAVAKGHTASMVEHAENDMFLWRIGGIPGGSTVTVVSAFAGPVTMTKKFGKKPQTEITLTLPTVVPPWYGRADGATQRWPTTLPCRRPPLSVACNWLFPPSPLPCAPTSSQKVFTASPSAAPPTAPPTPRPPAL
jgi:hypothetical protein